ncbi:MAG: HAD-IIA family hydrolase [Thermocrispum sp.]
MTQTLLDRFDALLLDLDGTVYRGAMPVAGAAEAMARARGMGLPLRFVTNNASKSPEAVAAHLRELGFHAEPAEVATSAQAGAALLADRMQAGTTVLVVGTEALAAEVRAVGLRVVREVAPGTGAVIQGHSPSTAWPDLAQACLAIRGGATWVACNLDPTLPTERGELPGNGSMVAALRSATGREPEVAGKPAPGQFVHAAYTATAVNPLVVGDRLGTDIAGANAAGFESLLVLSGVTTPETVLAAPAGQRPHYVANDMAAVSGTARALAAAPQDDWHVVVKDDALEVCGDGEPLGLLRTLCEPAWTSGLTVVRPDGEPAARAARSLDLRVIDYR